MFVVERHYRIDSWMEQFIEYLLGFMIKVRLAHNLLTSTRFFYLNFHREKKKRRTEQIKALHNSFYLNGHSTDSTVISLLMQYNKQYHRNVLFLWFCFCFVLFFLVWGILCRAPDGIKVSKHNILSQVSKSSIFTSVYSVYSVYKMFNGARKFSQQKSL